MLTVFKGQGTVTAHGRRYTADIKSELNEKNIYNRPYPSSGMSVGLKDSTYNADNMKKEIAKQVNKIEKGFKNKFTEIEPFLMKIASEFL